MERVSHSDGHKPGGTFSVGSLSRLIPRPDVLLAELDVKDGL